MNMNKEELEKEFDKKFPCIEAIEYSWLTDIKQFIFETMIVEVLKSIMPNFDNLDRVWVNRSYEYQTSIIAWEKQFKEKIKQKVKTLYNIEL